METVRSIILMLLSICVMLCLGCSSSQRPPSPRHGAGEMRMFTSADTGPSEIESSTATALTNDTTAPTAWKLRPEDEVAPGNQVEIRSEDAKLSGSYRINFDGQLKLPFEVTINTAGLSEEQLTREIRNSYAAYYKSPERIKVSIPVKEYLVNAQGLVEKPGQLIVRSDSSLDEIISQAGGLQESTSPDGTARYVRINGSSGDGMIKLKDYYSGSRDILPRWQGGETVFFQSEGSSFNPTTGSLERNYVKMLGQVKNPTEYPYEVSKDFYHYMLLAGGPTDRADMERLTLVREEGGETLSYDFSLNDAKSIPEIQAGDAIIVNADNDTNLEKKSRIAASIASVLSAIGIILLL